MSGESVRRSQLMRTQKFSGCSIVNRTETQGVAPGGRGPGPWPEGRHAQATVFAAVSSGVPTNVRYARLGFSWSFTPCACGHSLLEAVSGTARNAAPNDGALTSPVCSALTKLPHPGGCFWQTVQSTDCGCPWGSPNLSDGALPTGATIENALTNSLRGFFSKKKPRRKPIETLTGLNQQH